MTYFIAASIRRKGVAQYTRFLLIALLLQWLAGAAAQAQQNCPDGLVHYFGFDETASGTYQDYVSEATASCSTCPTPEAGLFNGAQAFKGRSPGITIRGLEHFEWGPNSSFTIELWMKASGTSSDNQVFIGRDAKDTNMIWWLGMNTEGNPQFDLFDNNPNRTQGGFSLVGKDIKINDNKWHHIVVVRDGRLRLNKLYVDGYTVGNFQYDYTYNFESGSPVNIGFLDLNNGYAYNGLLDEIMVYNRDLTENEVRARYNNGAGNYCGPQQVKPVIMSEAVTYGVAEQQYKYEVKAVGNARPSFALAEAPAGMSINATTGEISWVPSAAGSYKVGVTASNAAGSDRQDFTVTVKRASGETSGMLHHWMLHEMRGPTYHDYYTPSHAAGADSRMPKPVTGVISGGQEFDGEDDGLDVTACENFNWAPDESFSIELWMRSAASSSGNRVLIGRDAKDSEAHWWLGLDREGRAIFTLLDLEWAGPKPEHGSGPGLNDDQWHHLVAVRDGKSGLTELYVDGERVSTQTFKYANSFASRSPVNIGYLNDGGGYHYKGILDEVKLFGRALSAAEVKQRYEDVYDAITELVRFEGEYVGGVVQLTWETAAEAGLSHFEVERAPDTEAFEKLGEVKAAGNSNTPLSYPFTDVDPLSGIGYYRLKIVKQDGKYTYSNIIQVENKSLRSVSFKVYPNPVDVGDVTASVFGLSADEPVQFTVSDLRGKVLLQQQLQANSFGQLEVLVPITTDYRAGVYVLTVITDKRIVSRRLVVR
ncbi:putative secreted protein (Por secretion system target) [Pontibacter mucosus]|uniref:Putative secreted protein (Por secretion system target) n=1 Tax=Pontibacter mucosus TaxID=1649266 RepID=A0A2T5YPY9_9BACT|nr:LamG-like jellyroll fold domain-containing protein [Pontibacter mucosus]PTX21373.1 putative secreted protein (Por secretion system target) [Pontibacter mucosus]